MGVAKDQYIEYLRAQADLSRGYGAYLYAKSAATNTRGAVGQKCKQAKDTNGNDTEPASPTQPVRMEPKVRTTLRIGQYTRP